MRRLAVVFSALVVLAGGLSVALVAGASGRTRAAAHAQTVAKSPQLVKSPHLVKAPPLVKSPHLVKAPPLVKSPHLVKAPPLVRSLPQLKLAAPGQLGPAARLRAAPWAKTLNVPPYGACYVGLQQCSIHPCTMFVAPRTQAVASSAVAQISAQAPVPGPARSPRCVSTPSQKTEPVGNAVITAVPAKPVLRQSYAEPATGR
jgi:hypothetical protein